MPSCSGNRSVGFWLIIILLLIGTVYSIRWMYPLYRQATSHGQYTFVPLCLRECSTKSTNDDYFYYARVRDIIDGKLLSFDPQTYENRHMVSPHSTYIGSFVMSSLGGLLTGETAHAYYVNCFVYPALSFLFIFLLIDGIIKNRNVSLLLAALSIFFGMFFTGSKLKEMLSPAFVSGVFSGGTDLLELTQIPRMPALMFTNVHFSGFVFLLFCTLVKDMRTWLTWGGLALLLGLSSLVSSANFLLCYSSFVCCVVLARPQWPVAKWYATILPAAFLLSLPGLWIVSQSYVDMSELVYLTGVTIGFREGQFFGFLRIAVYLSAPVILVLLARPPQYRFLLGVLVAALGCYVVVTLWKGYDFGSRLMFRGAEIVIAAMVWATLANMVLGRIGSSDKGMSRTTKRLKDGNSLLPVALALGLIAVVMWNQYRVTDRWYLDANKPDYKGLYEWSIAHTDADQVALTLDFELLSNLSAHSPLCEYFPQALLSPTPSAERYQRFYETARLYGLTPEDMDRLLANMMCYSDLHSLRDENDVQRAFLQRILTNDRHYGKPMQPAERKAMVDAYTRVLSKGGGLTFKADYLIVSPFDRKLIRPGSPAEKIIEQKPVFANARYSVYRLPAQTSTGSRS